jgi:hypothetical protein
MRTDRISLSLYLETRKACSWFHARQDENVNRTFLRSSPSHSIMIAVVTSRPAGRVRGGGEQKLAAVSKTATSKKFGLPNILIGQSDDSSSSRLPISGFVN